MTTQNNFNAGEFSPQTYGRADIEKYPNALKTAYNMIPTLQGPIVRRPGSEFIARTKHPDKASISYGYEFSRDQAYDLEIGDQYIRFFKDGAPIIEKTATITGATQANPVVITAVNTFVNGEVIRISAVLGMTELNEQEYTVANATGTDFELSGIDGTGYTAYISGGDADKPYEVATTYLEEELTGMDFASINDVIYIAHTDHTPAKLIRYDHDQWDLQSISFTDTPDEWVSDSTATITGISQANPAVVTAANSFVDGQFVWITGVVGMTEVNGIRFTVASRAAGSFELEGIDSTGYTAYTSGGEAERRVDYPGVVCLDNDRLWWMASPSYPMRMWGSKTGIYNDHGVSSPLVDDDALNLDLASKSANAIQWAASNRKFVVGTTGIEYWITGAGGDGVVTALSKKAIPGSFNGSCEVNPVMAGNTILSLQRQANSLGELKYEFATDAFGGDDLSALAEHLTRDSVIVSMAFQLQPWRVVWCVREDGYLIGMTYYPKHEVFGWHQHYLGGDVKYVSVIPGAIEDEVWLTVEREVNGSTVKYRERLHSSFKGANTDDAFFVDSGLTLDNRQTIESITYANPGVINLTDHGYSNGDVVTVRSIDQVVTGEEDYQTFQGEMFTVANKTAHTFEVTLDAVAVDFTEYKTIKSATVALNQTVITGLGHLEGEEVTILADGAPVDEKTVSASQITLDSQASLAHIGIGGYSQIEILPQYVELKTGNTFGITQRITNFYLQLYKTLGFQYGESEDKLVDYDFVSDAVPVGQAGSLFNGFTESIAFDGGLKRDPTIIIRQPQPLPITIQSITTFSEIGED